MPAENFEQWRERKSASAAYGDGPLPQLATRGARLRLNQCRENLVRERLFNLLVALGDIQVQRALPGPAGPVLAQLLAECSPYGVVPLRDRCLPNRSLSLGCLVVAPVGAVVVDIAPGERCSCLVRDTLRRAHALRCWLRGTSWAASPVLAAVCTLDRADASGTPPLLLDRLWLGTTGQLPRWLGRGGALDRRTCAALGAFLAAELASD
jgi:hypothetical protein